MSQGARYAIYGAVDEDDSVRYGYSSGRPEDSVRIDGYDANDGVLLEAMIKSQPQNDIVPKLVRGLLAHRTKGHWGSTQENVFILLALDKYFNTFEKQHRQENRNRRHGRRKQRSLHLIRAMQHRRFHRFATFAKSHDVFLHDDACIEYEADGKVPDPTDDDPEEWKVVLGLLKPTSGEVRVFGKDIVSLGGQDLLEMRRRFGMLFQHAALLDWLTVAGNVAFPLEERRSASKKEIREQVDDILERLHITELRNRMPGEISEGQKKRVGLARAIIMKPEIMIYDEPTTGQDPIRTRDVDDMIQQVQKDFDITSIVISHDMASTFRIAHMIALLHQGQIVAYGTPEQIRASPDEYVQQFIYAGKVEA